MRAKTKTNLQNSMCKQKCNMVFTDLALWDGLVVDPMSQDKCLTLCLRKNAWPYVSGQMSDPMSRDKCLKLCLRTNAWFYVSGQMSDPMYQDKCLTLCLRTNAWTYVSGQSLKPMSQDKCLTLLYCLCVCDIASPVTCNLSHVTYHMSPITCNVSHDLFYNIFFYKKN